MSLHFKILDTTLAAIIACVLSSSCASNSAFEQFKYETSRNTTNINLQIDILKNDISSLENDISSLERHIQQVEQVQVAFSQEVLSHIQQQKEEQTDFSQKISKDLSDRELMIREMGDRVTEIRRQLIRLSTQISDITNTR